MKTFIRIYMTSYTLLLIVMIVAMATHDKAELHLMLNSYHTEGLDTFFRFYTKIAEYPLYILAGLALLFWKVGAAYTFAISEGLSALLVFVIKRICEIPRPVAYFEQLGQIDLLPLVEGVRMNRSLSFPSGHTSTFFTFFTIGAMLLSYYYATHKCNWKRETLRYIVMGTLLIFPIIGSYSRIYLSQHFLQDCFAGSLIGVTIPFIVNYILYKKGCFEKDWFNKSILWGNAYFPINKKK